MKNTLFGKIVILAMGSLFTFSGAALATTYNSEELAHVDLLSNSEIFLAEKVGVGVKVPLKDSPVFSESIATAETALGSALAAAESEAIGGSRKGALSVSIAEAKSLIGDATALSSSTAISDKKAVALSLAKAETVLGNAVAIAESDAITGPGKPAIASSLASAKTAVGNATAIARSSADP